MTADLIAIIGVGIALAGMILYLARALNELRRDVSREIADLRENQNELRRDVAREIAGLRESQNELRRDVTRDIGSLREQMHRETADLRERMARLEGLFEGFAARKPDKPE